MLRNDSLVLVGEGGGGPILNEELAEQVSIEGEVREFLREYINASISILVQIVSFYMSYNMNMSLVMPFSVSIGITVYMCICNYREYKQLNAGNIGNEQTRSRSMYLLFENCSLILFKVFTCLYVIHKFVNTLVFSVVFFMFYTGIRCVIYVFEKSKGEYS